MTWRVCLLLLPIVALKAGGQSLDIHKNRFTANVQILNLADSLPRDTRRLIEESGAPLPGPLAVGSINHVTYLYRDNGRALFANDSGVTWQKMWLGNSWAIECDRDAMDDSVTCRLSREDITIMVRDSGYMAVVVGKNHFPGSTIAIRVDQDTPIATAAPAFLRLYEVNDVADAVLQRIKAGRSLTTRYQKWPYQAPIDRTISLYGFNEALQFLNWVVSRYR